jgi:hypothetical protein
VGAGILLKVKLQRGFKSPSEVVKRKLLVDYLKNDEIID